jgi:hypothetical protein
LSVGSSLALSGNLLSIGTSLALSGGLLSIGTSLALSGGLLSVDTSLPLRRGLLTIGTLSTSLLAVLAVNTSLALSRGSLLAILAVNTSLALTGSTVLYNTITGSGSECLSRGEGSLRGSGCLAELSGSVTLNTTGNTGLIADNGTDSLTLGAGGRHVCVDVRENCEIVS